MKKYLTLKNLGWVLVITTAILVGLSGFSKVTSSEEMVKNFEHINLLPYLGLVGFVELIGATLLVFPRTSAYGSLLISSVMSAAVAIHLSFMAGAGIVPPLLFGLMSWVGHCLRKYGKF
jgi:uncharacterized membrane protein YphA (DoxX/SURF4 family)